MTYFLFGINLMLWSYVAYALAKTCLVLLGLALLGVEDKVEGGMREETTCTHVLCANTNRFSQRCNITQCPNVELRQRTENVGVTTLLLHALQHCHVYGLGFQTRELPTETLPGFFCGSFRAFDLVVEKV